MVLNPAVLQVTDWNREAINWVDRGICPRVAGLCRSNNQKRAPPPKIRKAVAMSTVRPWTLRRCLVLGFRTNSITRAKPKPPITIRPIIVKFTRGSRTNGTKD